MAPKKRVGRPAKKKSEKQGNRVFATLTNDELKRFDAAADQAGLTRSEFLRHLALTAGNAHFSLSTTKG